MVYTKPISTLDLTVRAETCLERAGVATVGDLVMRTKRELLELRHFGRAELACVLDALAPLGLDLAAPDAVETP